VIRQDRVFFCCGSRRPDGLRAGAALVADAGAVPGRAPKPL